VDAAQLILQSVQKHASPKTLVLCCISGGGSSLVTAPLDLSTVSLTLNDLQETNELLLTSGMDISKINMIRKQLDAIKGGKLAVAAYPSTILSLILSDVVGDDVASIASGPTVPLHGCDHSRTNRSIPPIQDLLIQYQLDQSVPGSVIEAIMKDQDNAQHPIFTSMIHPDTRLSETVVVGNNHRALIAAARTAKTLGYHPIILGTTVEGEAKVIAGMYIAMAEYLLQQGRRTEESHSMALASHHPVCLLAGGETTVTLPPNHASTGKKGGRNQELALAAALLLQKSKHMEAFDDIVLGSIGSDGTDGPTDAAGSIVDGNTVDWIEMMNGGTMLAKDALKDHDAYNFLSSGSHNRQEDNDSFPHPLIKTGPTGTNVADICVILIRAYRNR
jgi:glycerate-2-kinase